MSRFTPTQAQRFTSKAGDEYGFSIEDLNRRQEETGLGYVDQMNPVEVAPDTDAGTGPMTLAVGEHVVEYPLKKNKYSAAKVKYHCKKRGVIKFDSIGEFKRYRDHLTVLEDIGEIQGLILQRVYELQPAFTTPAGVDIRAITYRADFVYIRNGDAIIEDYKGMETPVFKLKWKLMQYIYGDAYKLVLTK